MGRKRTHEQLVSAVAPLLEPDEELVAGCAAWMADERDSVPLAFIGRAIYLVAVTNQRLLVFDTPRRSRPLLETDLLLQRPHEALELHGVRTRAMMQVQVSPAPTRRVVIEFRPRDRAVGHALVAALRAAEPAEEPASATP